MPVSHMAIRSALSAVSLIVASPVASGPAVSDQTGQITDTEVGTDTGKVRGIAIGDGAAWRGIPYAMPPVGELRWREARPVERWDGVRDAQAFGPQCIQPLRNDEPASDQSENCLTLNIVTPDREATGLPVLVSIHGGAFFRGSGRYIAERDISPMVARGVILVTPNYRLGRMGFFAHPALTREAGRGTGNFWLSDQIAALRWIKRNIAQFGGDPERIAIQGCSAGGSSVNSLMTSPLARGLFTRAAVHSGGGMFNATRPLAGAERDGTAFASRVGVAGRGKAALARLRALTPQEVLHGDPGPPDFGAIVDGHYLLQDIGPAFADGNQAAVPMIAGSTSNEASVFGLMGFDADVLRERFGIDLNDVRRFYDPAGNLSEAELLRRVQTDFIFTSAGIGMPSLAARTAPAWAYHFGYVPTAARVGSPGAPHCADMDFLYGLVDPADGDDRAVAETMRSYWYNFIARGNPNGPGLPRWIAAGPGEWSPLVIGNQSIHAEPGFQSGPLRIWHAKWQGESGASTLP